MEIKYIKKCNKATDQNKLITITADEIVSYETIYTFENRFTACTEIIVYLACFPTRNNLDEFSLEA